MGSFAARRASASLPVSVRTSTDFTIDRFAPDFKLVNLVLFLLLRGGLGEHIASRFLANGVLEGPAAAGESNKIIDFTGIGSSSDGAIGAVVLAGGGVTGGRGAVIVEGAVEGNGGAT